MNSNQIGIFIVVVILIILLIIYSSVELCSNGFYTQEYARSHHPYMHGEAKHKRLTTQQLRNYIKTKTPQTTYMGWLPLR
jgi:hypothetical protein